MNREEAFLGILEATSELQRHISLILEAKAAEAGKSRNWILGYVRDGAFSEHKEQLKTSVDIHEMTVDVIDGLTKMENGLARNLKAILNRREATSASGFGGFDQLGGMFDFGGGDHL